MKYTEDFKPMVGDRVYVPWGYGQVKGVIRSVNKDGCVVKHFVRAELFNVDKISFRRQSFWKWLRSLIN